MLDRSEHPLATNDIGRMNHRLDFGPIPSPLHPIDKLRTVWHECLTVWAIAGVSRSPERGAKRADPKYIDACTQIVVEAQVVNLTQTKEVLCFSHGLHVNPTRRSTSDIIEPEVHVEDYTRPEIKPQASIALCSPCRP